MSEELKALIEKARRYQMTPEERQEQRISLAYGNAHYENPSITIDDVLSASERLAERARHEGSSC